MRECVQTGAVACIPDADRKVKRAPEDLSQSALHLLCIRGEQSWTAIGLDRAPLQRGHFVGVCEAVQALVLIGRPDLWTVN